MATKYSLFAEIVPWLHLTHWKNNNQSILELLSGLCLSENCRLRKERLIKNRTENKVRGDVLPVRRFSECRRKRLAAETRWTLAFRFLLSTNNLLKAFPKCTKVPAAMMPPSTLLSIPVLNIYYYQTLLSIPVLNMCCYQFFLLWSFEADKNCNYFSSLLEIWISE